MLLILIPIAWPQEHGLPTRLVKAKIDGLSSQEYEAGVDLFTMSEVDLVSHCESGTLVEFIHACEHHGRQIAVSNSNVDVDVDSMSKSLFVVKSKDKLGVSWTDAGSTQCQILMNSASRLSVEVIDLSGSRRGGIPIQLVGSAGLGRIALTAWTAVSSGIAQFDGMNILRAEAHNQSTFSIRFAFPQSEAAPLEIDLTRMDAAPYHLLLPPVKALQVRVPPRMHDGGIPRSLVIESETHDNLNGNECPSLRVMLPERASRVEIPWIGLWSSATLHLDEGNWIGSTMSYLAAGNEGEHDELTVGGVTHSESCRIIGHVQSNTGCENHWGRVYLTFAQDDVIQSATAPVVIGPDRRFDAVATCGSDALLTVEVGCFDDHGNLLAASKASGRRDWITSKGKAELGEIQMFKATQLAGGVVHDARRNPIANCFVELSEATLNGVQWRPGSDGGNLLDDICRAKTSADGTFLILGPSCIKDATFRFHARGFKSKDGVRVVPDTSQPLEVQLENVGVHVAQIVSADRRVLRFLCPVVRTAREGGVWRTIPSDNYSILDNGAFRFDSPGVQGEDEVALVIDRKVVEVLDSDILDGSRVSVRRLLGSGASTIAVMDLRESVWMSELSIRDSDKRPARVGIILPWRDRGDVDARAVSFVSDGKADVACSNADHVVRVLVPGCQLKVVDIARDRMIVDLDPGYRVVVHIVGDRISVPIRVAIIGTGVGIPRYRQFSAMIDDDAVAVFQLPFAGSFRSEVWEMTGFSGVGASWEERVNAEGGSFEVAGQGDGLVTEVSLGIDRAGSAK
jgi:hypothetical protein